MEKPQKNALKSPRLLRYRSHYKAYFVILLIISGLILSFWVHKLIHMSLVHILNDMNQEFWMSCLYFISFGVFYFVWLRGRLNQVVQVFPTHICIHHLGKKEEIKFEDIESVGMVCLSIFYIKMKEGKKYHFSSALERVDYVWEGLYQARADLFSLEDYESFRESLIQYDHHQMRKEWFFKHKLLDFFIWIIVPFSFLAISYVVQSKDVVIYQQGMYFFRLSMYSVLVLLLNSFIFSIVLKKAVFDKKIKQQLNQANNKIRNIEFEGIILHRSKLMQMFTVSLVLSVVMQSEINFFSLTKLREDISNFNLKSGNTLLVDNRYNCLLCKYPVKDGDIVIFGKGNVGQIMAAEGDMVAQVFSREGRNIASENVQEVPRGHVALRLPNRDDIVMVKIEDLIGKIKK